VEEELDVFDRLLIEDPFVRKQWAKGFAEGFTESIKKTARSGLVDVVITRFPTLVELAEQRGDRVENIDVLLEVIRLVAAAPNEAIARFILST